MLDKYYADDLAIYAYNLGIVTGYSLENKPKDYVYYIAEEKIKKLSLIISKEDQLKYKLKYLMIVNKV